MSTNIVNHEREMPRVSVAGVQMDIVLGDISTNLERIESSLSHESLAESNVVVFPECTVCGYCFENRQQALAASDTVGGDTTQQLIAIAAKFDKVLIVGMLERERDDIYNTCVLVGPGGLIGKYRKTHLPYLGVDRFVAPGKDVPPVFDVGNLRIGVCICYDASFPEVPRILALQGADIVVLPTNWPCGGAEFAVEHLPSMRAMENHVYFLAVNRIGSEGGFQFLGQSKLCAPGGQTLACAEEGIIAAEISPQLAREKRIERQPSPHVIDRFADRRPELYRLLVEAR